MAPFPSRRRLTLRWATLGWAALFFVWLPFEDTNIYSLLGLSLAGCALTAVWQIDRQILAGRPRLLLTGGLSGLAVSPFALILVLVKAGAHSHGFLDFTNEQLGLILKTTPLWAVIGLAAAWLYKTRHPMLN